MAARDLPSSALLDLGDVELQKAVQPLDEFLSVKRAIVSVALGGGFRGSTERRKSPVVQASRQARVCLEAGCLTVIHPFSLCDLEVAGVLRWEVDKERVAQDSVESARS